MENELKKQMKINYLNIVICVDLI